MVVVFPKENAEVARLLKVMYVIKGFINVFTS